MEEYTRAGVPLLEALDQLTHLRAGGQPAEVTEDGTRVPTEEELARQNEASLRELQRMMGGI